MREVQGYFTARIPDSGDADLNPDTVPLTGHVTFRPEYRKPLVFPGEHIVLESINAIIIDGQLMVEVVQDEDVVLQALHLPVTIDERANQTWSWTMRFHGMTLGNFGEQVDLPDRRFPIEPGSEPLDLSSVAGTWSGGGLITRGAPGPGLQEITAVDGEIVFSWDNGRETTIGVPDAVPGRDGDPGDDGESAFEIAVAQGFAGTAAEWLESLQGEDGDPGARGIQGIQGPAGAGDGFPLVVDGWTETPADSLLESGLYRLPSSYEKEANGWPAAIEGMVAAVVIRKLWSALTYQEVRGWTTSGGTNVHSRWVRTGGDGTTPWRDNGEALTVGERGRIEGAFQQRVTPPTHQLNDLGDPGQYLFNSGSYATGENNFPEGAWGNQASVVVYTIGNTGGWKVQEITTIPPLASKSRRFYRQHRGGWGEWFELATTGEAHNTPGMFGARGDGLRDDTVNVQAWLNSIAERGYGTLPPGEYRITDTLTVSSDVRISGAGGVILIDGDFTAIESSEGDFAVELDGVHFRGTLGESAVPSLSAQRGLQLNNLGNVYVNNCRFTNIHEICVRIHNAESWAVTDSTFTNYGYAGIAVYTHGIGGTARGNHFYGTGVLPSFDVNTYAIATTHLDDTYRPARILIQGNVVRNQAWEALDTHGGTETIFDSNIIQGAEAGIVATPRTSVVDSSPSSVIISNNVVDAGDFPNPRQGISVAGSNASGATVKASGLVIGNTVKGYGRRDGGTAYHTGAMHVTRGEYVTITGNQIIAPYGVACRFRQADDCVFSDNTVVGIVAEDGVAVPRRFAQVEGAVSLTMQNNTVIDSDGYVPLYQNTGQSTGTVAAHGDGNSWDDRPPIAVA